MRLVTFNIRHGSDGPGLPADNDALARAVTDLDADVLGLQEVDRRRRRSGGIDQVEVVATAMGRAAVFGRTASFADGEYGNALVVRGEVQDVESISLPHLSPPWQSRSENRGALLATVDIDGQRVAVLVTHLSTRWYEAVHQLRSAAKALGRRPPPRVLMGDLNLGPLMSAPVLRRSGLSPVTGGGPTFPRRRPRARIDHVATAGLQVRGVDVIDAGMSDHRALVVDAVPE